MLLKASKRAYKILGWTIISLALLISSLRIFTHFWQPSSALTQQLCDKLPFKMYFKSLNVSWHYFHPVLNFDQVEINTQSNQPIRADNIKIVLGLSTFITKKPQIEKLIVDNSSFTIWARRDGTIGIEGIDGSINYKEPKEKVSQGVKQIHLNNARVDVLWENKRIPLQNVNLFAGGSYHIQLRANGNINGDNNHWKFSLDIPLMGNKTKQIYAQYKGLISKHLIDFVEVPYVFAGDHVEVETWASLQGDIWDGLLDVKSKNVSIHYPSNQPLFFPSFEGRFELKKKTDLQIKGEKILIGEQAAHTKPISFDFHQSGDNDRKRWHFVARNINVENWIHWSNELNLMPSKIDKFSNLYQPKGYIEHIHLQLEKENNQIQIHSGELVIQDVRLKSSKKFPGFKGLSGLVSLDAQKGTAQFSGKKLVIDAPWLMNEKLLLTDFLAQMHWQNKEFPEIDIESIAFNLEDAPFQASGRLQFQSQNKYPECELFFEMGKIDTNRALKYLPTKILDPDLRDWLRASIKQGKVVQSQGVLRGNLADFPFDENEGIFEIVAEIENATLDYVKQWPQLTDLKANLKFHNRSLFINAFKGEIANGQIFDLDAVIPDLGADIPILIIDGKILSDLKSGLEVINQSPLTSLAKTLSPINLSGKLGLSLGLEVPLTQKDESVKVRGVLELKDAALNLKTTDLDITTLNGQLSFTNNSIKADDLKGQFLNAPIDLQIHPAIEKPQAIEVHAKGLIDLALLKQKLKLETLTEIEGQSQFNAQLLIPQDEHDHAMIKLNSDLAGIKIDVPALFHKEKEAKSGFELIAYHDNNDSIHVATKIGESLQLHNSFEQQNDRWQWVGGHLHFGAGSNAKFRNDMVFLVDGEIPEMDLDVLGGLKRSNSIATPLEPLVELKFGDLHYKGIHFTDQKVEAQWDIHAKHWNVHLEGPSLQGHLLIPIGEDERDQVVNLKKLSIQNNILAQTQSQWTQSTPSKHPWDIQIAEFKLNNKMYENLKLRLEPSWKGYFIPTLKFHLKSTDVDVSGHWDYLAVTPRISLKGEVNTKEISDLGFFDQADALKGKGHVEFNLEWEGQLLQVNKETLNGYADFELSKGYIHGMNPGIGRVLSLLNIDNVQRRLSLDFRDVTKNSFSFNELKAKLQFGKGKIWANKIILNGPSAKITASGQADLTHQGLDAEMVVMPNVTGSLPLAAAIAAGNPAVGAAVWVVDKVFGRHIQQINRFHYKVAGTLKQPEIQELPTMRIGKKS